MLARISWARAILGGIGAEVAQIAALFLWIVIYSYVIDPGQPEEAYHRHAEMAGPWVSIIAGAIIFYAASRWIARSVPTALALFATFVLVDALILIAMPHGAAPLILWPFAVSYLTKLLACLLGGRHAERRASIRAA